MGLKLVSRKGNKSENEKEAETDRNVHEEVEEDVNLRKDGSEESIHCLEKRKEKKLKKKKEKEKEKNEPSELVEGQKGEEERPRKSEKEKRKKKGNDDAAKNVEVESEIGDKIAKADRKRKSKKGSDVVEFGERVDKNGDGDKKKKGTESRDVSSSADAEVGKSKKKTRGENDYNIKEIDTLDISGLDSDVGGDESTKERKKKKTQKKKSENGFDNGKNDVEDQKRKEPESEDVSSVADEEGVERIKKKKKTKNENVSNATEGHVDSSEERDTDKKKKKKKKKKSASEDASNGVESEAKSEEAGDGKKKEKKRKRTENRNVSEDERNNDDESDKTLKKKKKAKTGKDEKNSDNESDKTLKKKKKKAKTGNDEKGKAISKNDVSEGPKATKKAKRVSFSDDVEVFEDGPSKKRSWKASDEEGLVQGKRFTREEDAMVKAAVLSYIEEHNLGENGLDMVLNCKKHPEIRNCWKLIAQALPQRPLASIYYRAHILFERSELRKWTDEEREFVREFHKKHGSNWKAMGIELKKHRFHCKDLWRRIRKTGLNKGRWKQEEYQNLFDLVNMDLRMRALEERKSKHGMLRDNISWEAIGDRLATRGVVNCCIKWYHQLTSPMVAQGLWADTDDYRLIDALVSLDAPSLEEVDWDSLLEHRDGSLALKRWNQMVKHIGDYSKLSFSEQVEVLEKRYNPDCIEAREEFDSKPFSDVAPVGDDDASSD